MTGLAPYPHQIEGAKFLASREFAVLADDPRVGKTGAAIIGCDLVLAARILVVTTASGRGVWRKGFADWSVFPHVTQILTPKDRLRAETTVAIVGWPSVADHTLRMALLRGRWDVVILDEGHYAKNFDAKRTQAVFGLCDGEQLTTVHALGAAGARVWHLTGTPMPNSPFDLFPVLRFGAADRLAEQGEWPAVLSPEAFLRRYCETRPKKISRFRSITVITGGKNLDELKARIDGLFLRRTQADVGITAPIFETVPLIVPDAARRSVEKDLNATAVLAAIDSGSTRDLEMHLGPLRRLTGNIKARAVAELVAEEFDCGLDRIVLAYWHKEVAEILAEALAPFGVTGIDGSTPPAAREANVAAFSRPGGPRVFLAQIQAAGEAIDLSAAAEMLFVEMSFVPKDGAQMAMRVTNHTQTRQPRVRVASIAGSIDEAIQSSLLRKVTTIREVLKK